MLHDNRDLFAMLCQHLALEPDRRGEVHCVCPHCGKEPERGQVHFSFSERGGKCFVCGQGIGLYTLAQRYGLVGEGGDDKYLPAPAPRRKERTPWGKVRDYARYLEEYAHHADRVALWQAYKPVPAHLIDLYSLGVGVFPSHTSRCTHPRLMVPIIAGGKVIAFRGRAIACDCGKWLSNKGYEATLFHGERLLSGSYRTFGWAPDDGRKAAGRVVFIVENPIDAILYEHMDPRKVALATCSVSYWDDLWTEGLRRQGPKVVVVFFDNDRPGNGGGRAGQEAWLAEHSQDIVPSGVRLVNRLNAAGVPAILAPWPADRALKADIGDELKGELSDACQGGG
jgi:hypothetical protein